MLRDGRQRCGRCRADGRILTPEEEGKAADVLRADIVAEMQRQKDFLSLFVTSDWDQYVRNMARPGTWGGASLTHALQHV